MHATKFGRRQLVNHSKHCFANQLWLLLPLALVRGWPAWTDHRVLFPDEIYQSVEQAHRLVFGYGMVPWEFVSGARTWIFPGVLAFILKLGSLAGLTSGRALVLLIKSFMVALDLISTALAMRIAYALGGRRASIITGLVYGLMPAALIYSGRCYSELFSIPLLMLGIASLVLTAPTALAETTATSAQPMAEATPIANGEPSAVAASEAPPTNERAEKPNPSNLAAAIAGASLAISTFVRFQNGIFAVAIALLLIYWRRTRALLWYVGIGVLIALVLGLSEYWTWGRPFSSLLVYLRFNLIEHGSQHYGVERSWFYWTSLAKSFGPLFVLVIYCCLHSAGKARGLLFMIAAYFLLHSSVAHKEFRFLLPVLPLIAICTAVGFEVALVKSGRKLVAAHFAVLGVLSTIIWLRQPAAAHRIDNPRYPNPAPPAQPAQCQSLADRVQR